VDSQIVKCADTVGTAIRGYHGGKKITGRGRHLAVDCAGWLLALVVTAASVSDKLLVIKLFNAFATLQIMWPWSTGPPLARASQTGSRSTCGEATPVQAQSLAAANHRHRWGQWTPTSWVRP
jgi:hypothetical protein